MVGVPGKSKGCNTCRRRKKGCDQKRPICSQCESSGYVCGGYNRDRSFVIHPATKAVQRAIFLPYITPTPFSLPESLNRRALGSHCRNLFWQFYMPQGDCMCRDEFIIRCGHPMNWAELVQSLPVEDASLSDAFSALSISRVGQGNKDTRLVHESTRLYGRALKELQLALYDPIKMRSDQTLMACMLLGLYEVFESPTFESPRWLAHAQGAARLIQLRGPALHQSWNAHHPFLASRVPTLYAAILSRQDTYLAQPEWLTIPWEGQHRTYFDRMVDLAVHIPGYLERLDSIQESESESDFDFSTNGPSSLLHLLNQCKDLQIKLNQWRDGSKQGAAPTVVKHDALDPHDYPFKTDLWFANHLFVQARVIYYTCSLALAEAVSEIIRTLQRRKESSQFSTVVTESLLTLFSPDTHACNICRSVPYCLQPGMGALGASIINFPANLAHRYYQRVGYTDATQWLERTFEDVKARSVYVNVTTAANTSGSSWPPVSGRRKPHSQNQQQFKSNSTASSHSTESEGSQQSLAVLASLNTEYPTTVQMPIGVFIHENPAKHYHVIKNDGG